MAGALSNPRDLFLQLLSEALWVERTLVREVLPKLERQAQSESLAAAFAEHLAQTRHHVARVEQVFALVGAESSSSLDETAEKLAEEHDRRAAAAAATEHHELAAYEALIGLARALEQPDAARLLEANRDEEAAALERVRALGARLASEAAAR